MLQASATAIATVVPTGTSSSTKDVVINVEASYDDVDDDKLPDAAATTAADYSKHLAPSDIPVEKMSKDALKTFVEQQIKQHDRELGLDVTTVEPHPLLYCAPHCPPPACAEGNTQ